MSGHANPSQPFARRSLDSITCMTHLSVSLTSSQCPQWHALPPTSDSPGAAYDPTEVVPAKKDHVLPVAPRVALHPEGACQHSAGQHSTA